MLNIKHILAAAALALAGSAFAQNASPLLTRYADQSGVLANFVVEQPQTYAPGTHVFFTVNAMPRSRATVTIRTRNGSKDLPLTEVEPGRYEGSYTVQPYDDFFLASFSARADHRGRVGEAWATPEDHDHDRYDHDHDRYDHDHDRYDHDRPAMVCQTCGVITSVREVDEGSNEASAPGMLMGGLVGGAIGNGVAGRHDRTGGTILGAIIGGAVGNEIGKSENRRRVWIIEVSLDNGATQTFKNTSPPGVGAGQRVRVDNNQLVLDQR